MIFLDDFVDYKSGREKFIFRKNCSPFSDYQVGDYLEIDNDRTCYYSHGRDFDDANIVRKVYSSEIVRRNNASVNQASETIIQVLNRAIDSDTRINILLR